MRLYVDNAKCSGCNACRVACSLNLFKENNPKKAALIIEPHFPAPGVYNVKSGADRMALDGTNYADW